MKSARLNPEKPMRVAIIGAGGISRQHQRGISDSAQAELVGICDLDPVRRQEKSELWEIPAFEDFREMIASAQPDCVVVATDNKSHAFLTVGCAREGVAAIHCEKPMSVSLKEANEMLIACEEYDVLLTINHQRRTQDVAMMRERIEAGCIGELVFLRGYCAGDFLSDGTHLVDSLLALAGDPGVISVQAGMLFSPGITRFGHPVEDGMSVILDCGQEPVIELKTGTFSRRRSYQEYHLSGTKGELRRPGDHHEPPWVILDGHPGDHVFQFDRNRWFNRPVPGNGPWRNAGVSGFAEGTGHIYDGIRQSLLHHSPHPLDGRRTLQVQEIITAVYQSATEGRPVRIDSRDPEAAFPLQGFNP